MASLPELFVRVAGTDPIVQAVVVGVLIALLNTVGALAVLLWRDPSERTLDAALGFAAGVIKIASAYPRLEAGVKRTQ